MIEIAVKMVKLELALGGDAATGGKRTHNRVRRCGDSHLPLAGKSRGRPMQPDAHRRRTLADGRSDDGASRLDADPEGDAGARGRIRLRAVRRHVRAAEREARAGRLARASTASSTTAPDSPASPRVRSARCRATPTSPRSPTSQLTPVPWQPNLARFACDVTVEGEEWPYCPRTILRRVARPARGEGLRVQDRARARVLPRAAARRRVDRDRRSRYDTLEKPCYDIARAHAPLRLPDDGLEVLQRARLGQLRERPRGRERPVRAELQLRRRARLAATARSSSATWSTRSPSSTA